MPSKSRGHKSKRRNRNSDPTGTKSGSAAGGGSPSPSSFTGKLVNGLRLRFPMTQKHPDKMATAATKDTQEAEDVNQNQIVTKNCDTKETATQVATSCGYDIATSLLNELINGLDDFAMRKQEKLRNRQTYVLEDDASSGDDEDMVSCCDNESLLECNNTSLQKDYLGNEDDDLVSEKGCNGEKNALNSVSLINAFNNKFLKSFRLQKIEENTIAPNSEASQKDKQRKTSKRRLHFFGRSKFNKDAHNDSMDSSVDSQTNEDQFGSLSDLATPTGLTRSKSLSGSRRYASALDISSERERTPPKKQSSFVGRLARLMNVEPAASLRRSLSVRDIARKSKDHKDRLSDAELTLKTLAANDTGVSYDDLSFVNYDVFNTVSYLDIGSNFNAGADVKRRNVRNLKRTQSFQCQSPTEVDENTRLKHANSVNIRNCQSTLDLSNSTSGAISLPSLHNPNENVPENSRLHKYRRRPQSTSSEDGPAGSFRATGSGCAKLRRHNACRQKPRDVTPAPSDQSGKRDFFRREKSREDGSGGAEAATSSSPASFFGGGSGKKKVPLDKCDSVEKPEPRGPLTKQRSIGKDAPSSNGATSTGRGSAGRSSDFFKSLSKDKGNKLGCSPPPPMVSVAASKPPSSSLSSSSYCSTSSGVRKSDIIISNASTNAAAASSAKLCPVIKTKDQSSSKTQKSSNFSFRSNKSASKSGGSYSGSGIAGCASSLLGGKGKDDKRQQISRDDFLKATMRIFLVVSPPVGKIQVRSRSLNHLDTLEMRQAVAASVDPALKDSRSEPDCTRSQPVAGVAQTTGSVLAVPTEVPVPSTPTVESISATGRRYQLSKSQVSSSEYFSVSCELGDDPSFGASKEEFLPAIRGTALGDVLSRVCERRNVDLNSCDVWLQDKESNTHSWLCLTQDTGGLAGRCVRLTAKDSSNKISKSLGTNHIRKLSGSQRPRTTSFFSTSTEDATSITASSTSLAQDGRLSLQDFELGKKQTKQRWSGFFSNNKDTKMESLVEQLNCYAKNGVPTVLNYPQGQCESVDALYNLEEDWRDIVNTSDLTEKQHHQQTALWELITTEVAYIKTLKVVTDLFLACLKNLQANQLLKEIDTEQLFSNITEILDTSVCFWRKFLFPLVRQMRESRVPQSVLCLQEGFIHMRDNFYAYFRYCAEQQRCQHYCKENHAHNELFTAYLAWCETQKECNRLRLMDILVRPMQRLTKYGLLLKAILKNTDDEFEKDSLNMMIKSVDDFVNSVNSSLKQKQDNERLKGIIARIESYDAVETKDDDIERLVKSHCQLDLNGPMLGCVSDRKRHLLLEGDLKLKDNITSKMEVHCFLLTDMLLICKPSTKKGGSAMKVIRQPYLVDRLVVTELSRETPSLALVYLNEFKMAVAAFILQNNDAKKLKSWKDCIVKAQGLYTQARQMSTVVGEESLDADLSLGLDYSLEGDYHSLQLAPRSPLATSSRASRVSSLAHSHSGSVEMNDQSSIGSANNASRAISIENENRTASISSDEGVQPLSAIVVDKDKDKSPSGQKSSFKHRLFNQSPRISTPNTLSVQPYGNSLGQSLPNLTLGSPNVGTVSFSQNTLSVPSTTKTGQLLSPNHRGISYPPPSPTRGNLRRGFAISQSKNPPLLKTRHVNSTAGTSATGQLPASFDFDVPVIAGVSPPNDHCDSFSRGQHRQAMLKRFYRNDNKRYHTAGVVDDIKRDDNRDASIHKRLSWNCGSRSADTPSTTANSDQQQT